MKLGILGTGMIVQEVLPVLAATAGIDLVAILSTPRSIQTAEDLADQYGMGQATSDLTAFLANPEMDTVYIATPNHTHYDYAKAALLAGKQVICEKPFTLHLAELEDLVTIAKQKQLILLEAITNQYLENFQLIKDRLPDLGDIKIVQCNYSQYSSRYDAFKRGEIAPAFNPEMGGGALRDLNIYNIHLILGLFGSPQTISYLPNIQRGVDTSGILTMDFGTFKAIAIGAKDCSAPVTSTIQGDKGCLIIQGPTNSLPEIRVQFNGQEAEIIDLNGGRHRMAAEFEAFETIIREQDFAKAQETLDHSLRVLDVLDQASQELTRP